MELCYLGAVYGNLLINKNPMDFYFKPLPDGYPDGVIRVAPDLLPPGSIRIGGVWVDEEPYRSFDAEKLEVSLPPRTGDARPKIRVRIEPRA
jgi:hypothetical protein